MKALSSSAAIILLLSASYATGQEAISNKDVDAQKKSGRPITTTTEPSTDPAAPDAENSPAEEDWEAIDRAKDEAREEEDRLEQEARDDEDAERASEEAGFYRQDPDNPNKQISVDPTDEDFDDQLDDRRREREREQVAAEEDRLEGKEPMEESEDPHKDMVKITNPRTKDVEWYEKSDPRLKKLERDMRYEHVQLEREDPKEDE